jgi:predicted transposase YdaD
MRESSTYQAILAEGREEGREEGRAQEARRLLLLLGSDRYGPPNAKIRATIESIAAVERLEQLTRRLPGASSWEELMAST